MPATLCGGIPAAAAEEDRSARGGLGAGCEVGMEERLGKNTATK
jgi:hypothetical protein